MPGLRLRAATAALVVATLASATAPASASPDVDYLLHCQGCHLPSGRGKPDAVPSLVDSIGRFLSVPGGRDFLVRVPGSAQSALDDADLAALLNWMIRRFGPAQIAADFRPFQAAEVGRLRRSPLTDVASTRSALIQQMSDSPQGTP